MTTLKEDSYARHTGALGGGALPYDGERYEVYGRDRATGAWTSVYIYAESDVAAMSTAIAVRLDPAARRVVRGPLRSATHARFVGDADVERYRAKPGAENRPIDICVRCHQKKGKSPRSLCLMCAMQEGKDARAMAS